MANPNWLERNQMASQTEAKGLISELPRIISDNCRWASPNRGLANPSYNPDHWSQKATNSLTTARAPFTGRMSFRIYN